MRFVGECCVDLCVRAANRHILWTFVLYWKAWVVVVLISWSMPPSRSVRFCRRYVVVAWLVKAPVNSNAKQRLSQRKKGDESTRGHKELGFACAAVAMAREREPRRRVIPRAAFAWKAGQSRPSYFLFLGAAPVPFGLRLHSEISRSGLDSSPSPAL
jgi:hypothetical protein